MQKVNILIPTVSARKEKLKNCLNKIVENTSYEPVEISVLIMDSKDWVWKILHLSEKSDSLIVYLADDVEVQKDWLKIAVDKYERSFPDGDGLLCFNDGLQYGRIAAHGLTSTNFLKKYFHSGYKHFFVDKEFTEKARKLGRYVYCPESVALHIHPSIGKTEIDETYKDNYAVMKQDQRLYKKRND